MAYHFVYVASKAVFRLRGVRIPVAIVRESSNGHDRGDPMGKWVFFLHYYHLEGVNCRVEVATHITRDFSSFHQEGIKSGTEVSAVGIK